MNNNLKRLWVIGLFFSAILILLTIGATKGFAKPKINDTVISADLMFPQKMVVMNGVDYVMDEGQLLRVTEKNKEVLADVKDIAEFKEHDIKDTDIPTFRPGHMIVNNGTIYVSGNIHRDFGENDGSGAVYHMILSWHEGKNKFDVIEWGREQNARAPVISDWNDGENPQLMHVGDKWIYDYLGKVRTRQAMTIVNNHLYYTYFANKTLNTEGLAYVDLADNNKVHKLIQGYGFDTMSGAYMAGDYWQGNGPEYSLQVSPDEKEIKIIDGDHNIYNLDLVRGKLSLFSRFYNSPDSSIPFMTKGKVHNGVAYYLNNQGIYKQPDLKKEPKLIFNPDQYRWNIENGIGNIADWDWVDDNTIDLLDFTNHRIVRLTLNGGNMDEED